MAATVPMIAIGSFIRDDGFMVRKGMRIHERPALVAQRLASKQAVEDYGGELGLEPAEVMRLGLRGIACLSDLVDRAIEGRLVELGLPANAVETLEAKAAELTSEAKLDEAETDKAEELEAAGPDKTKPAGPSEQPGAGPSASKPAEPAAKPAAGPSTKRGA